MPRIVNPDGTTTSWEPHEGPMPVWVPEPEATEEPPVATPPEPVHRAPRRTPAQVRAAKEKAERAEAKKKAKEEAEEEKPEVPSLFDRIHDQPREVESSPTPAASTMEGRPLFPPIHRS